MPKPLLAKDRRRWSRRKGIAAGFMVLGGLALAGLGYVLYRKLIYDRPPATGETKDWSGCWEPPDWVQPRPAWACGSHIKYDSFRTPSGKFPGKDDADYNAQNVDSYIIARVWTNGTWVYETLADAGILEPEIQQA